MMATNVLPLSQPSQQATHTKFNLAWKWARPRMLRGQLSRVPWPGNSWMPFTFQPALQQFSSPTRFTLTPANYSHWTNTSLHSICFINSFGLFFFTSKRISPKYWTATFKCRQANWKGCRSHQSDTPPCWFWLPLWEKVNRSRNLINSMRVTSSY